MFTIALTATGERGALDVYHSAANQKYMLRHIKIMDESISGKKRINAAQLTNLGNDGQEFVPKEMDTLLLMLYGHMLQVGKSHRSALNYYTRAYALNPESPVVSLCIALSYMHRSMQRQSENRHFQALQCWVFLSEYAEKRRKMAKRIRGSRSHTQGKEKQEQEIRDEDVPVPPEIEMEIEYNIARAEQHYGLSHLAVRRYENVLRIGDKEYGPITKDSEQEEPQRVTDIDPDAMDVDVDGIDHARSELKSNDHEKDPYGDLRYEAAYNLQMIYMTSGCEELAMEVTKRWLVI